LPSARRWQSHKVVVAEVLAVEVLVAALVEAVARAAVLELEAPAEPVQVPQAIPVRHQGPARTPAAADRPRTAAAADRP
jgi:hypothetical protein